MDSDEGSCRLLLCCHGKLTREHNDAGGKEQILNIQGRLWASSNETGYLVHVLDLIGHAQQGSPISRCVRRPAHSMELTDDVEQCALSRSDPKKQPSTDDT